MKARAFLAVLLWAAPAVAHIVDVRPVRAALRADPGVLRVTLELDALAWSLLAAPRPDRVPPDEFRRRAADYVRGHFAVSVDGRPLDPRVLGGKVVRALWQDDLREKLLIRVAYDLPPVGGVFSFRAAFFREDWEALEGQGRRAPPGVARDFRTLLRWSPAPGGAKFLTMDAPQADVDGRSLLRSRARRWGESAAAGVGTFFSVEAGVALAAALLLFVPAGVSAPAGAAGGAAALAGAFLPLGAGAERALWAAVVGAGAVSLCPRGTALWLCSAAAGAAAAARMWAFAAAEYKASTAFDGFSPAAFAAGLLAVVAAALLLRRALAAAYRWHFRHLTPEELARQSLFHRHVGGRSLAIAGLYRLLSPLWTAVG